MEDIPGWLGTGVLTAALAALGYTTKAIMGSLSRWYEGRRDTRADRLTRLLELKHLLRTGKYSFRIQAEKRDRLHDDLTRQDSNISREVIEDAEGFEEIFSLAYDHLTPEQRDRHGVIRSITTDALYPINQALLEWLRKDTFFKAQWHHKDLGDLAKNLGELEVHLILWFAKYNMWMGDPKHALVYLADEKDHGVGFPQKLEQDVDKALELFVPAKISFVRNRAVGRK